jgi:archaellum component FlaF (FlaF/FlaG flagellin family)
LSITTNNTGSGTLNVSNTSLYIDGTEVPQSQWDSTSLSGGSAGTCCSWDWDPGDKLYIAVNDSHFSSTPQQAKVSVNRTNQYVNDTKPITMNP